MYFIAQRTTLHCTMPNAQCTAYNVLHFPALAGQPGGWLLPSFLRRLYLSTVQCSASTAQQYTVLHSTALHYSTRNQCRLALFCTTLHRSAVHSLPHSWVHLVHSCGADLWLRGNASINLQASGHTTALYSTIGCTHCARFQIQTSESCIRALHL